MLPIHDENPTHRPAVVTAFVIAACVAAFLWLVTLPPGEIDWAIASLGAVPLVIRGEATVAPYVSGLPSQASLLTSLFLHAGLLHLGGNMLYLWVFGNNVEDRLGHLRFLAFYLLAGVAATGVHVALVPDSDVPVVGASGAISGVLGAYVLLFPLARVRVLVPPFFWWTFRLPAWLFIGLWFVYQALLAAGDVGIGAAQRWEDGAGIAWDAHVAGFLAGVALVPLLRPRGVPLFHGVGGRSSRAAAPPPRPERRSPPRGSVPDTVRSAVRPTPRAGRRPTVER
jgi:membrane associated rhomboid family serine protease